MVTPHFYLNHTFMLGTNIPHIPANAMYDFSTQIVLPGNQLVVAHLAPGGGVDGRCVALTQHKASRPAPRVRTDIFMHPLQISRGHWGERGGEIHGELAAKCSEGLFWGK